MSDQTIRETQQAVNEAREAVLEMVQWNLSDVGHSEISQAVARGRSRIDALISAVRQEAGAAALRVYLDDNSRTLADFRPQHDEECASRSCQRCGHLEGWHDNWDQVPAPRWCQCHGDVDHAFKAHPCTCGLDPLLAALAPRGSGAGQGPP